MRRGPRLQHSKLSLGHFLGTDIRNGRCFEVIPNGFQDQYADLTALLGSQTAKLLFVHLA